MVWSVGVMSKVLAKCFEDVAFGNMSWGISARIASGSCMGKIRTGQVKHHWNIEPVEGIIFFVLTWILRAEESSFLPRAFKRSQSTSGARRSGSSAGSSFPKGSPRKRWRSHFLWEKKLGQTCPKHFLSILVSWSRLFHCLIGNPHEIPE